MNTSITYQYRDASNYNEFDTVIIRGQLSLNDIEEYLYDKEFFIPSEIGLKDLQPESLNQDDHIWHEILEISHTTNPLWTESPEVQKYGLKVLFFRWRIYCKTKNGIVSVSVISSFIANKFLKSS